LPYHTPVDVANRALQHLGKPQIGDFTDQSEEANETRVAYDNIRLDEMSSNLWRFATRRVILRAVSIDSVMWTPPTWVAGTFAVATVAAYTPTTGVYMGEAGYWQASVAKTASNTTTPDQDADWKHYTGPLAIDLYDSGATYFSGELVLVPAAYDGAVTYAANAVVSSSTTWYVSLTAGNIGNAVSDVVHWAPWTSRGRAMGSYGATASSSPIPLTYPGTPSVYVSLANSNADNPVSALGNWQSIAGTVAAVGFMYPIGTGPVADSTTANVFRLPNGFLKRAPTDPKGNTLPYLGSYSGVAPEDWLEEGDFMVSSSSGPLLMRFVADVTDVSDMDTTFCEALAARMACDLAHALKAPDTKRDSERAYKRSISSARTVNSIEIGPIGEVENRYITVRY
jgi:hypothetical protein